MNLWPPTVSTQRITFFLSSIVCSRTTTRTMPREQKESFMYITSFQGETWKTLFNIYKPSFIKDLPEKEIRAEEEGESACVDIQLL